MNEGDSREPFDEPDNGVVLGASSPFQFVPPPLPEVNADTAPIPLDHNEEEEDEPSRRELRQLQRVQNRKDREARRALLRRRNGLHADGREYFFRRHFRSVLSRLLVKPRADPVFVKPTLVEVPEGATPQEKARITLENAREQKRVARANARAEKKAETPPRDDAAPIEYLPFTYGGLAATIIPVAVFFLAPGQTVAIGWIFFGLLLLFVPVTREIYRWRTRVVLMQFTESGMRIVYLQPKLLLLGFLGNGNDDTELIEGSVSNSMRTNTLNRVMFIGCGDLTIAAKIEADKARFQNVPNVKRLQAFLAKVA